MFDLVVNTKSVKSVGIAVGKIPKQMPQAMAQAQNRTVDHLYTQISREVRKDYSIKDKDVKSTLKKRYTNAASLNAAVTSTGRTLTLYNHFRVSPNQPRPGTRYKVKVTIKKGQRQTIGGAPSAFVAAMKGIVVSDKGPSLNYQVVRREGNKRYPVTVLRSLSVPQMVSNKKVMKRIKKSAEEMLKKRTDHEIDRRITKAGAKK